MPAEATQVRLMRYTGRVWGWVGCEAVTTHLNSRDNFKLNRTAALTECLSAATAMPLVNTTTGVGMTAVVAECDQH